MGEERGLSQRPKRVEGLEGVDMQQAPSCEPYVKRLQTKGLLQKCPRARCGNREM